MNQKVFVTDNFKLAMALTASGFSIRNAHNTVVQSREGSQVKERRAIICELDIEHNGVTAEYLRSGFEKDMELGGYRVNLAAQVDEIIKNRGITDEEYVILAFDAARAALHNRGTVMYCVNTGRSIIAMQMKDGRSLIYMDGTPKEDLKKILSES